MSKAAFDLDPTNYPDLDAAADYARLVFVMYVRHLAAITGRATGLSILELGPGIDLGAQILLAEMGNEVTVAEPYLVPWNACFHPSVYRSLAAMVGGAPALEQAAESGDVGGHLVRRIAESAENLSSLGDEQFDVVISTAVLEHVRDIGKVCAELKRVTKRCGYNSHQIDLRYHRSFDRPLDHFLMSDEEWIADATANNFELGTRMRASEFIKVFNHHGLITVRNQVNARPTPEYLAEVLPQIRTAGHSYSNWSEEDFRITGMRLVTQKL
jgi:hypothetical protein